MADAPKPEKLEQLHRLEDLSNDELKAVIDKGRHVRLPANWSLIWEKTPADKAYLILDGTVSVRQHGNEIAQLTKGDIVGEAAIVNHSLRTASIVALTPLEMIHFTDDAVRRLCDEMPSFKAALEAVAVERFGAS